MFWELYQWRKTREAKHRALMAGDKSRRLAGDLKEGLDSLEEKIDGLALLCQAQWELLKEHTGLTEEQIERKAMEIDRRDGTADAKMASRECFRCQRPLHRRRTSCIYCGASQPQERFQT